MKLNVGDKDFKGIYAEPEWLNIDIEQGRSRSNFIKMSVLEMPEDWNEKFETIHMIHCLEHINRNFRQQVIKELYRVLQPGGVAFVEVPNFEAIVKILARAFAQEDTRTIHLMTTSIYGKQRWPGDGHRWGYTHDSLATLFHEAGFSEIKIYLGSPDGNGNGAMISQHYKQEPVLLVKGTK